MDYSINPAQEVTVEDFRMAKYELDHLLYDLYKGGYGPLLGDKEVDNYRVYTHHPAIGPYGAFEEMINLLNEKTGKQFRFPTEAEWEWAARGGVMGLGIDYAGSNELSQVGLWGGSLNLKRDIMGFYIPCLPDRSG